MLNKITITGSRLSANLLTFLLLLFCAGAANAQSLLQPEFTAHRFSGCEYRSRAVLVDINGDGRSDLIRPLDRTLCILFRRADGLFNPPLETPLPDGFHYIDGTLFADIDNDRIADLVLLTGQFPGSISIARGNGDGTFGAASKITAGGSVIGEVVTVDANGDGLLDLAATLLVEIWEYPNNYSFVPSYSKIILASSDGSHELAADVMLGVFPSFADVDNDGIQDALGGFGVQLGNGEGSFRPPLGPIVQEGGHSAVGDFNGDGNVDLVVGEGLDIDSTLATMLYFGRGDGSFESPLRLGNASRKLQVLDWNADGALDLVTSNFTVSLYQGRGDGSFATAQRFAGYELGSLGPRFEDMDGDGRVDLSFIDSPYIVTFQLAADGSFGHELGLALPQAPFDLDNADFDHDGHQDIVAVSKKGRIDVLFGQSGSEVAAGHFTQDQSLTLRDPWDPTAIQAVDVDADGWTDLLVANRFQVAVSLFYGEPNRLFSEATLVAMGESPVRAASGDVDGDGRMDLVTANEMTRQIAVRRGTGVREFGQTEFYQLLQVFDADVKNVFLDLQLSDLDQDGKTEIIALTASNLLVLHDIDGTLAATLDVPISGRHFLTADFNGDGLIDIVIAGPTNVLLQGQQAATFAPPRTLDGVSDAVRVTAQDLDADGDMDLVFATFNRCVQTQLNDGTGLFEAAEQVPTLDAPADISAADWNGDGRPDVIVSGFAGHLTLLRNTLPPLATVEALQTESAPSAVVLNWQLGPQALSEISGIDVARSAVEGGALSVRTLATLAPSAEMSFTDIDLQPGAEWYYTLVVHYKQGMDRFVGSQFSSAGRHTTQWDGVVLSADGIPELRYSVGPGGSAISTVIFDVRGRRVRQLESRFRAEGKYAVTWNGRNDRNEAAPRGIYFVQIQIKESTYTDRVVLLRR